MSDSLSIDFFKILINISLLHNQKKESEGSMGATKNDYDFDDLFLQKKTIAVETTVPDGGSSASLTPAGYNFIESCIKIIGEKIAKDTQIEVTFQVEIYVPETEDDEGYNIYKTSSVFSTTPDSIHIDDFVIMRPYCGDFVLGECP